jgi:hypothetical protein
MTLLPSTGCHFVKANRPTNDVNSRLTENQVRLIFDLLRDGIYTQAEIAEMLDVSRPTISMINQGRIWQRLAPQGWTPAPPIPAVGERNGFAKLCADEVREIFRLAWSGAHTLREIGERFGVSLSQVWLIKTCREWRHLQLDDERTERMSDNKTKDEEAEFQTKLTALQTTLAKLAALREADRERPEWQREMAQAVPTDVVQGVAHDLRRGVSEPSSIMPQPRGPQIQRGSGWATPNPITPPPGVALCDSIMDAADRQDRADLERRLARSAKPK